MKPKIGVIGSAAGDITEELKEKAREIGIEIARYGCILLTGATTGLSYEAVKGAKEYDGLVVGISPASNLREHVESYKLPTEHFDVIIFTGFGYKGRNVVTIRSSDGVIAISGRIGTLNELTIAYDEGKVIGVLKGSGGVCDSFEEIVKTTGKKGGVIISEEEPKTLVKKLIESLYSRR